ncbi:hypothetical protein [Streptomyces odonnellii]|uniref:hypothetical protein n=1 Tax=Streptomyces odonnellii TaxID=1417980 RepID=UPI0006251A26|nr:hypothetical protein [Streptomyces odonnellii]
MNKTDPTPSLDDIHDTLAEIVRLVERGSADRWPNPVLRELVLTLLRKLSSLTGHALKGMRDAELAETQAVYGLVARKTSQLLGLPEADVYRAVIAMCDDAGNPALTDGLPPVDPRVADKLSRFLVRITVVYRGHEGDRDTPRRSVRMVHGHSPGDLRETEISQDVGYERLPDDIRVDLMKDAGQVQFQLFPKRV